ncbi:ABC transporter permease [Litoreibacter roseus]|uniref:ABC transmembrane type-1 domain-containing protein n=1 Tax=Litoreibacter roseus TaxID=2601869 RepID=A0A6N6JET6_9RHOB|nr:ABC transporter permease subunit [Litoreibacter roseus]GFE64655.1 hypothetical protein KIN_17290 [Litoreibacter roseus]
MTRTRGIHGWLSALAALALWEIVAQIYPNSFVIAGPLDVLRHMAENTGLLSRAVTATLHNAAWGFLWGNLGAIILSCTVILLPRSERTISLLALTVFCLPLVATGPILRVLYGPGNGPQIALAALAVYYTTYLALVVGLRAIPQNWSDLTRIYGRGRMTELFYIRARASLPYLIAGLQIAAPAAILGAMIGEFTGADRGLGVLTLRAMRSLDVDATWALASLAATVSILVYGIIGWIGRRLVAHPASILMTPPPVQGRENWSRSLGKAVALIALVLVLWHSVMDIFDLNRFFAKRPLDIWRYLTTNDEARSTLRTALTETSALTVPGYLAGLGLGAGLAILLTLVPALSATVLPAAIALRSVPIITTAPLIVLALGRGAAGTIIIVAVMIFFPTLIACLQGLRQTPGQIIDMFDSYAAGRLRLMRWARIPAMLPAFFASARMAIPAAFLAVTTTEWLATGKGIGNLMALTATTSNYNMLWSAIVVVTAAATLAYLVVERIERAILRVYASEQVQG